MVDCLSNSKWYHYSGWWRFVKLKQLCETATGITNAAKFGMKCRRVQLQWLRIFAKTLDSLTFEARLGVEARSSAAAIIAGVDR